jgi:hypothetical protein
MRSADCSADEDDVVEILVDHELRDLRGVRGVRDARPQRVAPLGTAVQRRRVHDVPGRAQSLGHRLPDPATLIRPVDQHEGRHALTLRL